MSHWGPSRTLLTAFDTRVHRRVRIKLDLHILMVRGKLSEVSICISIHPYSHQLIHIQIDITSTQGHTDEHAI